MLHTACIYNFGRVYHENDWNFRIPGSVFWRIYHVMEGSAQVRIYGHLHRLRPGYFYMIPAFVAHEDILEGSFVHRYLHFRLDDGLLSELAEGYDFVFEVPATPLLIAVFSRIEELCNGFELETPLPQVYERKSSYIYWTQRYESLPQAVRLELDGYVRVLIAEFMRQSPVHLPAANQRVAKGRGFIDRHFGEPVTVEDVARHVDMRPESLIRAFRNEYGRTPHAYLMEKRINRAKNLLLLSTMSVKEIAGACGFTDASYFGLVFRRVTSVSPGDFRKGGGASQPL